MLHGQTAVTQKAKATMPTDSIDSSGAGTPPRRSPRGREVLTTAIRVMSERGYSATSMRLIADHVGMLKGSLYHYFPSKEDLLLEILEESHTQLQDIGARVAATEPEPLAHLLAYLRASSLWYLANVDRANIFFTDRRNLTGERYESAMRLGREFESKIQSLVDAGCASGEIRGDLAPELIARFVMGTLNNVRRWPNRKSPGPENAQMSDALVELIRSAIAAR